jgi:hypothetical protein
MGDCVDGRRARAASKRSKVGADEGSSVTTVATRTDADGRTSVFGTFSTQRLVMARTDDCGHEDGC